MAKLKLKTKRAAKKRFKLTGTGKLVDHTNEKVMKKILPYL